MPFLLTPDSSKFRSRLFDHAIRSLLGVAGNFGDTVADFWKPVFFFTNDLVTKFYFDPRTSTSHRSLKRTTHDIVVQLDGLCCLKLKFIVISRKS